MSESKELPRLEDLPPNEIPASLRWITPKDVANVVAAIGKANEAGLHQRRFARQYTDACLRQGTQLNPLLAAIAFHDEEQNEMPNGKDKEFWQKIVPRRQEFEHLLGTIGKPQEATIVGADSQTGKAPAKEEEKEEHVQTAKDHIQRMEAALKQARQQQISYEEVLAYARGAARAFSSTPAVVLKAAICFEVAYTDRKRPLEDRIDDLRSALRLTEELLSLIARKDLPYRNMEDHKKLVRPAMEKCAKMRATIRQAEETMKK
ncbi:MAG: hypothetical protein Greene041619_262 [Candidatus Peregrinibacteria bacterium Greene0416_19]|nr:MAG: hypothetical protein Greene041619_262 [Candidatus Peregrinibacteria bacterium Greene0416_19]